MNRAPLEIFVQLPRPLHENLHPAFPQVRHPQLQSLPNLIRSRGLGHRDERDFRRVALRLARRGGDPLPDLIQFFRQAAIALPRTAPSAPIIFPLSLYSERGPG